MSLLCVIYQIKKICLSAIIASYLKQIFRYIIDSPSTIIASVITAAVGYYCYNRFSQTREDQLKSKVRVESGWRNRLFELEKKTEFKIEDLFEINACINPFKDNLDIDYYVNKTLLLSLSPESSSKSYMRERLKEVFEEFIKYDKGDGINNKMDKDDFKKIINHENLFESGIMDTKFSISNKDTCLLRIAIHALLKVDFVKAQGSKLDYSNIFK